MGDPVHESVPLSPDHRNDVIEPDRNLEEQIIEDKERLCDDLSNVYKEDFISAKVKMASWDIPLTV
uniref:Uncharacterized protein n=1 Tax=Solanum lycopersicum TaxID=4081 RepID=A0A3Q7FA61_SOLLC